MPVPLAAEPPGRITGLGGIFFRSKDPEALMAWYRDMLGLTVEAWGGIMMPLDAPSRPPVLTLSAVDDTSDAMAPSGREFMLNFAVDDLAAFLHRLTANGVPILHRDENDPNGKFAWIIDPDGTKIELWEPRTEDRST